MLDHDEVALATMLDSLEQHQLETLAAAVRDNLFLRRAMPADAPPSQPPAKPQRERAPQPAPPRSSKHRGGAALAREAASPAVSSRAGGDDDELDGGLAGKWLSVPPGGTLPSVEQPKATAALAGKPAAKPAATPRKKPVVKNLGDLD